MVGKQNLPEALCDFREVEAERARFELAVPFGTRALQARALGRTTLPLRAYYAANYTRTMSNDNRSNRPRQHGSWQGLVRKGRDVSA